MSIVILGSNGMLGSMLYYYAKKNGIEIIDVDRSKYDAIKDSISKLLEIIPRDSYVINCIGAIPQKKYADQDFVYLNSIFPKELSKVCKSINSKLIHISTNCVFSGKKPYCTEIDIPDEEDIYGKSKYEGEPVDALTIRCSIIGFEKGSKYGLLEWFLNNNNESINGYIDSFWNGLTTLELSKIIYDIILNKKYCIGLYHYYSENTISKYELLNYVKNIIKKKIYINPIENGKKNYTLKSLYTIHRENIYKQIDELLFIHKEYILYTK